MTLVFRWTEEGKVLKEYSLKVKKKKNLTTFLTEMQTDELPLEAAQDAHRVT